MADGEAFDVLGTFRRPIAPPSRGAGARRVMRDDDEEDDPASPTPPSSAPAPAPAPPRPEQRDDSDSDSDSDDEGRAAVGSRRGNAQAFVGVVRDSALPDADEDDHIICQEEPIVVEYDATGIDQGSGAFWVLEYEKALIAEESLRAKREIRAKVKGQIIESAHKKRVAQFRTDRKRAVEAEKRSIEARIAALKSQLEDAQGGRAAAPDRAFLGDIQATFTGGAPITAVGRRHRVIDEDDDELDALIAARREATERVLAVMRSEVQAFGAHLMAEAKAIAELQRKKKIPGVLQTPVAVRTPEALNAIIAQVESAYETLS